MVGVRRLSTAQDPRITWMGAARHPRCRSHRSLEALRLPSILLKAVWPRCRAPLNRRFAPPWSQGLPAAP